MLQVKPGDELVEKQGYKHDIVKVASVTKQYITLDDGRKFHLDGKPREENYANGVLLPLTPETRADLQAWHDTGVIFHYNTHNKWHALPPEVTRKIVAILEEHEGDNNA